MYEKRDENMNYQEYREQLESARQNFITSYFEYQNCGMQEQADKCRVNYERIQECLRMQYLSNLDNLKNKRSYFEVSQ